MKVIPCPWDLDLNRHGEVYWSEVTGAIYNIACWNDTLPHWNDVTGVGYATSRAIVTVLPLQSLSPFVYIHADIHLLMSIIYKYKKQLQKIEKKVGMEYQKAYKQG